MTACKKETPAPVTQSSPVSGAVVGFLNIRDEFGNMLASQSGVKVKIENASPEISALTDSNGRFILNKVKPGPLSLVIEGPGFEPTKEFFNNVSTGGESPFFLNSLYEEGFYRSPWILCERSTTSVTDVGVSPYDPEYPYGRQVIRGLLSNERGNGGYLIFFGKDGTVSKDNYLYSTDQQKYYYPEVAQGQSTGEFTNFIPTSLLYSFGFTKGDRVYFVVYGAPKYLNTYIDLNTRKNIFTNLSSSPSNVSSFIL